MEKATILNWMALRVPKVREGVEDISFIVAHLAGGLLAIFAKQFHADEKALGW